MSVSTTARGRGALVPLTVVGVLLILHNDFWWWNDATRVLGLPVGLFYHVAYCFVVSVVFAWIVRDGRAKR